MSFDPAVPDGNVYPKYSTGNPLARRMMAGFLATVDELSAPLADLDVHEVGCGEGHLLQRFIRPGRQVRGSDYSGRVIEQARQNIPAESGVTLEAISLYDLVPARHAAGLVVCCEVLEHIDQPERGLDMLAALAQPYLLASVPREPLWRVLNLARGSYVRAWGNTPGHVNHWSKAGFVRFLARRFEILTVRSPLPWTVVLCRSKKA